MHPGETLRLEPLPQPGTPPTDPRITVQLDIRDTQTEQPVRAAAWLIIDYQQQLIANDVTHLDLELPGTQGIVTIRIIAPNYQLWELSFNYKTKYNRILPLPVRLKPPETESTG